MAAMVLVGFKIGKKLQFMEASIFVSKGKKLSFFEKNFVQSGLEGASICYMHYLSQYLYIVSPQWIDVCEHNIYTKAMNKRSSIRLKVVYLSN